MKAQISRKGTRGFTESFAARSGKLLLSLALAGCGSTQAPPVEMAASPAPAMSAVPEPPARGVVGVSVGRTLAEDDQSIAIAAQQDAISSGERCCRRATRSAIWWGLSQ